MKKIKYLLFFIVITATALSPLIASAQRIPAILHPVNDYGNILTPFQENRIAKMLIDHRKKTGVQIAVLTVGSTGQMSIEEFSIKTAEKWGGGSKERDDGLLFTVAVYDRRMRIEVGYGLEGYITDLRAGRILGGIRDDFKSYKYGQGIEKAVTQIISATDEIRPGQETPASVRLLGAFSHIVEYFIIFFIAGVCIGIGFVLVKRQLKFNVWVSAGVLALLYVAIPILVQIYLSMFWYWTPIAYLTGALVGACIIGAILVPKSKAGKIAATIFTAIFALASMISIYYFLHIMKPSASDTTDNETYLLIILSITNFIQLMILLGVNGIFEDGGGSSSNYSSSSSSSSSSSTSSSSNDTNWSGGGGSYGGGGASSSW